MTRKRNQPPKPDRQRGKKRGDLYQQARRDVQLSLHPFLQTLKRSRKQATQDTRQTNQQVSNVYGALGSQLSALDAPYQQTMAGISSNLSSGLEGLSNQLGTSVGQAPASETAAAGGLLGAIGSGGLSQLASSAATNAGYNTSAQRQGIEENAITRRNNLLDLQQYRGDIRDQRQDIMRQAGPQTLQRLDALKQQQLDRYLAMQQLALSRSGNQLSWASYNHGVDQDAISNEFWRQMALINQNP